jgi:hypothetical protein
MNMIMRYSLSAVLVGICVVCATAQKKRPLFLGITGGTHLTWQIDSYNRSYNPTPGLGWNFGMKGAFDVLPGLGVLGSISTIADQTKSSMPGDQIDFTFRHSWVDGSMSLLYKPIRRESYTLLVGVGLSVRRLINSTSVWDITSVSGEQSSYKHNQSDLLYPWNYSFNPQIGAEFPMMGNSRLQLMAEYNLGLRDIYDPYQRPTFYEGHHKLISGGINISWLWGLKAAK